MRKTNQSYQYMKALQRISLPEFHSIDLHQLEQSNQYGGQEQYGSGQE